MDIRNVQKTGNMFYVYLPTKWCRKHNISSESKVTTNSDSQGGLVVQPQIMKRKERNIKLHIDEKDKDLIIKLIVACYINPTTSFEISLGKEVDISQLINEKSLTGGLDLVDMDGHHISYESNLLVTNPESLLKTMIKKIKNMILVKTGSGLKDLMVKYEDEIDKSHFLIDKAVISAFSFSENDTDLKHVYLFYISIISQNLEKLADHIISLEGDEVNYLNKIMSSIEMLQNLLNNLDGFNYKVAIEFSKLVSKIGDLKVRDLQTHRKNRIKKILVNISEVLMDWSVTKEIDK